MVLTPRFIAKSAATVMASRAVSAPRAAAQSVAKSTARVLQSGAAPAQLSFFFKRG